MKSWPIEFEDVLAGLWVVRDELERLELELDASRTPWTPGRLPNWKPE